MKERSRYNFAPLRSLLEGVNAGMSRDPSNEGFVPFNARTINDDEVDGVLSTYMASALKSTKSDEAVARTRALEAWLQGSPPLAALRRELGSHAVTLSTLRTHAITYVTQALSTDTSQAELASEGVEIVDETRDLAAEINFLVESRKIPPLVGQSLLDTFGLVPAVAGVDAVDKAAVFTQKVIAAQKSKRPPRTGLLQDHNTFIRQVTRKAIHDRVAVDQIKATIPQVAILCDDTSAVDALLAKGLRELFDEKYN